MKKKFTAVKKVKLAKKKRIVPKSVKPMYASKKPKFDKENY
jgi:hypothetical protein